MKPVTSLSKVYVRIAQGPEAKPGLLDVLAAPYLGPKVLKGKDTYGTFFSTRTQFHEEQIPTPAVVYRHGYLRTKKIEFPGSITKRWRNNRGQWFRIQLDLATPRGQSLWKSAKERKLYASTGVIPASYYIDEQTGEILSWLIGEVTLIDSDILNGINPSNYYATAAPVREDSFEFKLKGDPPGTPGLEEFEAANQHQEVDLILDSVSQGVVMNPEEIEDFINDVRAALASLVSVVDNFARQAQGQENGEQSQEGTDTSTESDNPAPTQMSEGGSEDEPTRTMEEEPQQDKGVRMALTSSAKLRTQLTEAHQRIAELENRNWVMQQVQEGFIASNEVDAIVGQLNAFGQTVQTRDAARSLVLSGRAKSAIPTINGATPGTRVLPIVPSNARPAAPPSGDPTVVEGEEYMNRMRRLAGVLPVT